MHVKFDDYFSTLARLKKHDLPPGEKLKQLNRLHEALEDWGTCVFPDESFDWWVHYDAYGTLPYPGSLIDQPTYVRRDLTLFTMLKRFWELNEDLPSVEGLPTLDDLIHNGSKKEP